jgi:hypothetical protein
MKLYSPEISGSLTISNTLTVLGNLTVFGTASYTYVSASSLNVGTNTISVNIAEPAERFGGLIVYDSGSISHQATASLLWDSLKNKWIYQNVSGAGYDGGMAIFGPRNTAGLGNEQGTTNNSLMKGQGGDHITSSRVFDNGTVVTIRSNAQVTGSLTVTGNVFATASWASNARTASFLTPGTYQVTASRSVRALTASFLPPGTYQVTASRALTASFISPTFISASAAAAGFGSGGTGGPGSITLIQGGTGINITNGSGPTVTVSATGTSGGTNLGLVYAVSIGYLMP